MEKISVRLQARVSSIVQVLLFDNSSPIGEGWVADMLAALQHYQERKGDIGTGSTPPLAFLDMDERQRVFAETGKLRISLYKVLLFRKLRDGLRNGSINVLSSYDYRAFEEYMLPRPAWLTHRQAYLTKANLIAFARPAPALLALSKRLNAQFQKTNSQLGVNKQVFFDRAGHWHLHRYEADEESSQQAAKLLYPTNRVIALRDVLLQVHQLTGFLDAFTHQGFVHKPARPDDRLLIAAIIGYGRSAAAGKYRHS